MNKLEIKIKELNNKININKDKFNKERLITRNVVSCQDEYFKKQDLLRAEIEKYERQNTLYNDLKDIGIIRET